MRLVLLALLVVVSCKKSEPATSAEQAAAPAAPSGSAAPPPPTEPAPAPTPPPPPAPPPPATSPHEAAIEAAIAIFNAVAPITEKYRDGGEQCLKGVAEVDKVLDGMKPQVAAIQAVIKTPETAKAFFEAYLKQDESPLHEAKSKALGPAIHCEALHDRIQATFGLTSPTPAKKKK